MATGTTTTTTTLSNNNPIVCNTFNHQQYLLLLCYPNNPTNIFTARAGRLVYRASAYFSSPAAYPSTRERKNHHTCNGRIAHSKTVDIFFM